MPFPVPDIYSSEAADLAREESKRAASPPSYYWSRSWSQVLAATYFTDDRLAGRYRGVAAKHRHQIQSAAFGQIMAGFEWCLKDFIAQVINATDLFDAQVERAKWIELQKTRVLAQREATASIGAILIHPTQGWHDTTNIQDRYGGFFSASPLTNDQAGTLERLWILRHSVAHNAGFVTNHDAYRMRAPGLSQCTIHIDEDFLRDAHAFLADIVRELGNRVGKEIVDSWLREKSTGDYDHDVVVYRSLKHIASVVESRSQGLPEIGQTDYDADRQALGL